MSHLLSGMIHQKWPKQKEVTDILEKTKLLHSERTIFMLINITNKIRFNITILTRYIKYTTMLNYF